MELKGYYFDVSDGHRLWVTEYGAAQGHPVLFLHGGPGSGCTPSQQDLFDPKTQRVVFLDQRGAGKSLPSRARHANRLAEQLADIEALRQHLGITSWTVVGGSWGATLALAYAQSYPAHIAALVLRAVFLGTRAELDWAFGTGLLTFYPKLHAAFLAHLPQQERGDPLGSYWRRILDPDPLIHAPAAWIWHDVERALSTLAPAQTGLVTHERGLALPRTPFMEAHYFSQNCFLAPDALMNGMHALADVKGIIVQGRYDLLCPPTTSARVAENWPNAELRLIEGAGHSLSEPAIFAAVKAAIAEVCG